MPCLLSVDTWRHVINPFATLFAGIREYARRYGAAAGAVEEDEVEAWLSGGQELASPEDPEGPGPPGRPAYSLFAYPALDNYAGVMYPLRWVAQAQASSTRHRRWKVLLDAAAYVPTHRLNLTQVPADFVCVSFYKMFGMPTGVGAWIVRTDDGDFLRRASCAAPPRRRRSLAAHRRRARSAGASVTPLVRLQRRCTGPAGRSSPPLARSAGTSPAACRPASRTGRSRSWTSSRSATVRVR
jgi:hypothetical protein